MDLEDKMVTATPEGVSVEVVLAGVGSRSAAIMLDTLIQLVILVISLLFVAAVGAGHGTPLLAAGVFVIIVVLDFFGYFVLLELLTGGRTVGKMAAGLRAIRVDGTPIGFFASFVRTVMRLVDYLFFGVVGLLSILATDRNQRLGDLVGGTIVVRERRAGATRSMAAASGRFSAYEATPVPVISASGMSLDARAWDVSAVSVDQAVLAERFLRSRAGYTELARTQLAARLANLLAPSVSGAPPGLTEEQFLEGVVAAKTGVGWVVPTPSIPSPSIMPNALRRPAGPPEQSTW